MTPKERDNPSIINYSRKKRIANGCGLSVEQVNKLLKQFEAMQKMTKQLTSMARSKGKKGARGFPGTGQLQAAVLIAISFCKVIYKLDKFL